MIDKKREYQLMEFINDDVKVENVTPSLNDEELEWYKTELGWTHYVEKMSGKKVSIVPVKE